MFSRSLAASVNACVSACLFLVEARKPETPRATHSSRRERRAKGDTFGAGRKRDSGAQPLLPNYRVAPAQLLESRQR